MGAQCKKMGDFNQNQEYSSILAINHPAFGHIFYLKSQKNGSEKGIKRIGDMPELTMQSLKKRMEFAKECDNTISTLVQIYDFDVVDSHGQYNEMLAMLGETSSNGFNCGKTQQSFILVHFQYYPPQSTLQHLLKSKQAELTKMSSKYSKNIFSEIKHIKMCDYQQIDKCPSQQRQLINVYYQQIEIIRMIDHLIGAVYFLHHFDVPHAAIRPDNIIVDEQGKYILVDREIFQKKKNYDLAREFIQNIDNQQKEKNVDKSEDYINFLSPQLLPNLKNNVYQPRYNSEKADIYSIGLIALKMCLLQNYPPIFEYNNYLKKIKMNQGQLKRQLTAIQQRYSEQFIDLLLRMLEADPRIRIDFAQLIDDLNPLLLKNLEQIKQIHAMKSNNLTPNQSLSQSDAYTQQQQNNDLKTKLISMQKQFQKVMKNRTMLFNRKINDKELKDQEDKILKKLATIQNTRSTFTNTTQQITKYNPQQNKYPKITIFNPVIDEETSNRLGSSSSQAKRYISGKQLQQIVWKQYQNLKSKRIGQK